MENKLKSEKELNYNKIKSLQNDLNKKNEELNKAKKVIDSLNNKIKVLENRINSENNSNQIQSLQNIISQKDLEINNLKLQLFNINTNTNQNNLLNNKDKCVNFISNDENICFAIPCFGDSTFAEVEELLYREYPEYRETNNTFFANGKSIDRFKTINDNKIGTGKPIMLISPTSDD